MPKIILIETSTALCSAAFCLLQLAYRLNGIP